MTTRTDDLIRLLNLAESKSESEAGRQFTGPASHEPHIRAFGGQVAAQALMAAYRTVDAGRPPHSLHCYFLRPGSPDEEIVYEVESVRNGRSFSMRHVDAVQRDKVILQMSVSFHSPESGIEHSDSPPQVTGPRDLETFDHRFSGRQDSDMSRWFVRTRPFDIRYVDKSPFDHSEVGTPPRQFVWIKTFDPLPDSQQLHDAIFTYISDMTVLDPILLRHGIRWTDDKILGASLDHTIWFHRAVRVDEWLLLDLESPIAVGGRALARGRVWTESGELVATLAQEALMRPPHVSRQNH